MTVTLLPPPAPETFLEDFKSGIRRILARSLQDLVFSPVLEGELLARTEDVGELLFGRIPITTRKQATRIFFDIFSAMMKGHALRRCCYRSISFCKSAGHFDRPFLGTISTAFETAIKVYRRDLAEIQMPELRRIIIVPKQFWIDRKNPTNLNNDGVQAYWHSNLRAIGHLIDETCPRWASLVSSTFSFVNESSVLNTLGIAPERLDIGIYGSTQVGEYRCYRDNTEELDVYFASPSKVSEFEAHWYALDQMEETATFHDVKRLCGFSWSS